MLFPIVGFSLFPKSEKPQFLINVEMPNGTSVYETDKVARYVETELKKEPEIKFLTTNVGKGNPQIYYNVHQQDIKPDFAQIFVQLQEETTPDAKTQLIKRLRGKVEDVIVSTALVI